VDAEGVILEEQLLARRGSSPREAILAGCFAYPDKTRWLGGGKNGLSSEYFGKRLELMGSNEG